jgi:hypothetical protein
MSLLQNIIYKSIVLQPGEQFILPPGAVVISSTNASATQSSCDDLDSLEDLECFTFVFGNAATDGGSAQLFEAPGFPVVAFRVGGAKYTLDPPFAPSTTSSPVGQYDLAGLVSAINSKTGGVLVNPVLGEHNEGGHGIIEFITFRTTSSLADTMELIMRAGTSIGFNETEYVELSIRPRATSTLTAYSGVPNCV